MTKPLPEEIRLDGSRNTAAEKRLAAAHLEHEAAVIINDDKAVTAAREAAHQRLDALLDAREAMMAGIAKAAREGRLG